MTAASLAAPPVVHRRRLRPQRVALYAFLTFMAVT